jgi:hypothetical protein
MKRKDRDFTPMTPPNLPSYEGTFTAAKGCSKKSKSPTKSSV